MLIAAWKSLVGVLTQIATGSAGEVWGVASDGTIWQYTGSDVNPWQSVPGPAGGCKSIDAGSDGSVWGISSSGFPLRRNGSFWVQVTGSGFVQISVGSADNVWARDASGQIYQYMPGNTNPWFHIVGPSGGLSWLAVGSDGTRWGVTPSSKIYRWNSGSWTLVAGGLSQISVGSAGQVIGVAANSSVWFYSGNNQNPWTQVTGSLSFVSIAADGTVWGLNSLGNVFRQAGAWLQVHGGLRQISVGSASDVWGVASDQTIWQYSPSTLNWSQVPGALTEVAVGSDGTVWGLDAAGHTYSYGSSSGWTQFPGVLSSLSAGSADQVWGVASDGTVWLRYPGHKHKKEPWKKIPAPQGGLASIAAGADGTVWGLNSSGGIFRATPTEWKSVAGQLSQITVGSASQVWGIAPDGTLWQYSGNDNYPWRPVSGPETTLLNIAVGMDGSLWGVTSSSIFRLGLAVMPSAAQLQTVQTNLANMQSLNDYVYTHGLAQVTEAYLLLSEPDDSDPGKAMALNVLESAFGAVLSEAGPIGSFAGAFLSGVLANWAQDSPASLNGQFASFLARLEKTTTLLDEQLAGFIQTTAANWYVQFTYNGSMVSLADLTAGPFPAETQPLFEELATSAVTSLTKKLWTQMLAAIEVITLWRLSSGNLILHGDKNSPPIAWAQSFIDSHPAYNVTWTWHDSSGCGDSSGWIINEYNLGTGASLFSDGSLNADACQFLFQDNNGTIINPDGLFTRDTVFNDLGIQQTTRIVSTGGGGPAQEKLSMGYLRAMKAGKTLGLLVDREGRATVERRVIEEAQRNPVFADDLRFRPRQTLEQFLDVKIPEVVSVNVIVETPRSFALIVPLAPMTAAPEEKEPGAD